MNKARRPTRRPIRSRYARALQFESLESRTLCSFSIGGITIPNIPGLPSFPSIPGNITIPSFTNGLNLSNLSSFLSPPTERWWLNNTDHPGADINAQNAWGISTGNSSVVIAVLDTGIDLNNADLASVLWTNPKEIPGDGIDNDNDGHIDDIHGWNFLDNNNNVQDNFVHGTAVAATIHSVAPGVTILPVEIGTAAGVSSDDVIAGINYIINLKKAGVNIVAINASYISFTPPSMDEVNAIKNAGSNGILYDAAAGNAGLNLDSLIPNIPSEFAKYIPQFLPSNLIFVAATDKNDNLASFSDYGANTVAVGAPGKDITLPLPGGLYASLSGTSFAAPMVSGIVGLLKSKFPSATLGQLKDAVLKSGDLDPSLAGKTSTGRRVDAFNALNYLMGNKAPTGALEVLNNTTLSGWAFEPNMGSDAATVIITMDGTVVMNTSANITRNDLTATLGSSDHGFSFDTSDLPYGKHTMKVFVLDDSTNKQIQIGQGTLTVNDTPIGTLDTAATKTVTGWALDPDTLSKNLQVKLFLDGKAWLTTTANLLNNNGPDNASAHGYKFTLPTMKPGIHRVDAYAVDSLTGGLTLLGNANVSSNQQATGQVESLNATTVTGWAFDPDTSASIQVQYQIDDFAPVFINANVSRPDLQATLGSKNHGFTIALPQLNAGDHTIVIRAVDANNKMLTELDSETITVADPDGNPLPTADFSTFNDTQIIGTVTDSHADTPTALPTHIRIDIDGKPGSPFLATTTSTDGTFAFSYTFNPKLTGVHRVDVWAFDDLTNSPVLVARRFIDYTAPTFTLETFTSTAATGFALAPSAPNSQALLRLDIDDLSGALVTANLPRPDQLLNLGILKSGFNIPIPQLSSGDHFATLYLIDPLTLTATSIGTLHIVPA